MTDHSSQFDPRALKDRLFNDTDLIKEIADIFLEETPHHIKELKFFAEAKNAGGAQEAAHKIKGAAANMSAEYLQSIARNIELTLQRSQLDNVIRDIESLESSYKLLEKDLVAFLNTL